MCFVHFVIADLRVSGRLFFHRPAVLRQGKPSRLASSHICVATPPPSFLSLFLLFAFSLRLLRATSANFRLLGAHLLPPFFALPLRNEDTYFLSFFQQSYRAWALNSWLSSCVNPSARALFHETDLSLSHVNVDDAAYIQQQHASWCQGEGGRASQLFTLQRHWAPSPSQSCAYLLKLTRPTPSLLLYFHTRSSLPLSLPPAPEPQNDE